MNSKLQNPNTIVDQAKFLELICYDTIICLLKSYADTVLFYYLGYFLQEQRKYLKC